MCAGWPVNRQKSDACVNKTANSNPRDHSIEDGVMDVMQLNKEAGEEKED